MHPARMPASAERRTAEWVTALSPVIENDEGLPMHGLKSTPKSQLTDGTLERTGEPKLQVSVLQSAVAGLSLQNLHVIDSQQSMKS